MRINSILTYSFVKKSFVKSLLEENARYKTQIEDSTNFIKDIENGKLDTAYDPGESSDNQLSAALKSMQLQLKKISEEEKNRNWATEGLAKFADILRQNDDNINQLGDRIIANLVKYLNANQGGIFVLNEDNPNEITLDLIACYAYNRKKHLEKTIAIGEGLVGQTFIEKETIYMTELPPNYTAITSGLGDATPGCLVLIPLKINDEVLGVLEIASFEVLEKYKIDFLEKVGESIASSLTSVRIAHKTEKLLRESQLQTEQLRSQEEEVRQNMEELSATQEEMQRVLKEAQSKEKYLNELINVPKDSIFTVDKNYQVISFNKSFSAGLEAMGVKVEKGFDFMLLLPDAQQKQKQKALFDRAFMGESFEQTDRYDLNNETTYYLANYAPLYNDDNEIFAVASFSKDVSAMMKAQIQAEELLLQSKQQGEEMMAQEEELRQNMEELSATQEEMQRVLKEAQGQEEYLNELINVPKDSIFTIDRNFQLISFNKSFSSILEAMGVPVKKGFDFLQLFPTDAEKEKQRALYGRAFNGENFEQADEYDTNGVMSYYIANYAPLYNEEKEIFAVASFSKDVTTMITAQKQTEQLLLQSKQQEEEVRAQEEELRQNMEELAATQEDMHRLLTETKDKEHYLDELINAQKDSIFTIDKNYKLISFNQSLAAGLKAMGLTLEKGFDILSLFPDKKVREKQIALYKRGFDGENFEQTEQYGEGDQLMYYVANIAPLYDDNKEIFAVASFSKDITPLVKAQKQTEELLLQSKKQAQDIQKALEEVQEKEHYLDELINAPNDSIFTIDKNFKVVSFNKALAAGIEAMGIKLEKGFDILQLFPDDKARKKQMEIYERAFKGESFEQTEQFGEGDQLMYFLSNWSPIKNREGKIVTVASFSKDVTALVKKQVKIKERF